MVGTCELVEVIGPLRLEMIKKSARSKMNESPTDCEDYQGSFAWVLGDVRRLVHPVVYKHPSGAVTWVRLDDETAAEVLAAKSVRVH